MEVYTVIQNKQTAEPPVMLSLLDRDIAVCDTLKRSFQAMCCFPDHNAEFTCPASVYITPFINRDHLKNGVYDNSFQQCGQRGGGQVFRIC
jgi:hypothetical protein